MKKEGKKAVTKRWPKLWSIRLDLSPRPEESVRFALEEALEPFGAALSSFERAGGKDWRIEVVTDEKPAARALTAALRPFGVGRAAVTLLPDKDWVAQSERGLPPIEAGPFFVHGSHFKGNPPKGKRAFLIDAGMAFGTGRHETTRGCLLALTRLAKARRFSNCLDVGTGTGILAFAMAHFFAAPGAGARLHPILAADNDRDAVRIARENVALNALAGRVRVVASDGYRAPAIRARAPFDLIVANILANPLIVLAPALARVLARNGRAVLSGLMRDQERAVLAAHEAEGLVLDFRLRLDDWSVLVLKRAARGKTQGKVKKSAKKKVATKKKSAKKNGG